MTCLTPLRSFLRPSTKKWRVMRLEAGFREFNLSTFFDELDDFVGHFVVGDEVSLGDG